MGRRSSHVRENLFRVYAIQYESYMEPASLSQSTSRPTDSKRISAVLSAVSALLAGAILRFWMLHKFFEVRDDSELYGGIAKNLLLHGRYALTDGSGILHDTLVRLPGYPLFLAACFRLFGMENYFAPVCIQIAADLAGCVLLALLAWRITPSPVRRAGHPLARLPLPIHSHLCRRAPDRSPHPVLHRGGHVGRGPVPALG